MELMVLSNRFEYVASVFEVSLVGQLCCDRVGREFRDHVF